MPKHKSKKILDKIFGYLFALELVAGSYVWINIFQKNVKYAAGNGFPSSIVSKTAISPKFYDSAIGERLIFYLPRPSDELLSGLEMDTIRLETILLDQSAISLEKSCNSLGLLTIGEEISQEELSDKAEVIFEELNKSHDTEKDMPEIEWKLDEQNEKLGGFYRPGLGNITLFKPGDYLSSIESLTHELSHTWFIDETLNILSTEETLLRLAERYGEQYLKDNSDKTSGRDACLYGLAAKRNMVLYWKGIYRYLEQPETISHDTQIYKPLLDYYILPGLIMRYAALNDSVEKPVIDTTRSYNLDISATQGLIEKILLGEEPAGQFPFD